MLALDVAFVVRYYLLPFVMLAVAAFAVVHAARQRPDAYTAVDKLTKGKWLAILAASTLSVLLFRYIGGGFLFSLVGTVAIFVYLADVRPKIDEVQRGPRW